MTPVIKAAVEPSALIRRVNRQLQQEGLAVRRGKRVMNGALGDYFLIAKDRVVRPNVDLEKLARARRCLEEFEVMAQ